MRVKVSEMGTEIDPTSWLKDQDILVVCWWNLRSLTSYVESQPYISKPPTITVYSETLCTDGAEIKKSIKVNVRIKKEKRTILYRSWNTDVEDTYQEKDSSS